MIKRLGLLLVTGIVLAGCGTVSLSDAMDKWVTESNFNHTQQGILSDASHAAESLRATSSTPLFLHTVCGVLLLDTEQANASLPTPDNTTTRLLSTAYDDFGAGANLCYRAGNVSTKRQAALSELEKAAGFYAEAKARMSAVQ